MSESHNLGQDIRALRTARKLTLEVLAKKLDKSVGWLSQVERNLSHPSMDDLRAIASAFDVPISLFFGTANAPEHERGIVVRNKARREIGAHENGLIETLVSPDLTDDFEVIHSTFQPGANMQTAIKRPTTEVGYLVSGKLDLWIGDQQVTLSQGDSFRIRGESYRWSNPYSDPAIAVWVISPPVY